MARAWATVRQQQPQLCNLPEYQQHFGAFWDANCAELQKCHLKLRPCRAEPCDGYEHGAQLVRSIVKQTPGYQSRTDQPPIHTFCNQQAQSSIASDWTSQPDLAYCGYGQKV